MLHLATHGFFLDHHLRSCRAEAAFEHRVDRRFRLGRVLLEVARLHLDALGVELTELTKDQAESLMVAAVELRGRRRAALVALAVGLVAAAVMAFHVKASWQ